MISKVLSFIDSEDEELIEAHLDFIPSGESIDDIELYKYPRNKIRLEEYISSKWSRLSKTDKIELITVFLSHFARLHKIDVAHQDIGLHSIWVSKSSLSITISNFLAASFPGDKNFKNSLSLTNLLAHNKIKLPEAFKEDSEMSFNRDVFLAGSIAHFFAFGKWPQKLENDVYHWQPIDNDIFSGSLDSWFEKDSPCMVIHGIAGIGKSTLVADWLSSRIEEVPHLSVCWYPCQPWDKQVGLAVSLLHRFGVDDKHDPYQLMETLPLTPGAEFDVDAWRRRLLAYLTDAKAIRERFTGEAGGPPPYWLIILDDVHHVAEEAGDLLGALLDISKKSPLRLLFISRTTLNVYDRRDVHTREVVEELPLKGLTVEEISSWVENMEGAPPTPEEVHKMTGGHPLALELLEIYGQATHGDWLKFLDEEIITQMPQEEHELLATLAVADSPVPWSKLSSATGWEGKPPERLLSYGLLLELEEGMWLHEALRERFLREVGENSTKRKKRLL